MDCLKNGVRNDSIRNWLFYVLVCLQGSLATTIPIPDNAESKLVDKNNKMSKDNWHSHNTAALGT